jgi:hypothetical protein
MQKERTNNLSIFVEWTIFDWNWNKGRNDHFIYTHSSINLCEFDLNQQTNSFLK